MREIPTNESFVNISYMVVRHFIIYYLVTSPLAFGYADVGCLRDDDTLRRVVTTATSGFDDLILEKKNGRK